MKEIKFKAWDVFEGEMVDVDRIDFIEKEIDVLISKNESIEEFFTLSFEHIDLLEYVGMKDKNGIEIYHNYIVKAEHDDFYDGDLEDKPEYKPWIGVVRQEDCGYVIKTKTDYSPSLSNIRITSLEVIGNLYENTDLLRG